MATRPDHQPKPRARLRPARQEDLYEIARVYLRAFPDSRHEFHSPDLSPLAVADALLVPLLAEPGNLLLAHTPAGEIVGYLAAVTDASLLLPTVLRRGLLFRWLGRWLRGRYHLPLRAALSLLRDKLHLRRNWREEDATAARILSLAVAPEWQGRGLGEQLLEAALQRLRELGRPRVRLEVRPENLPARRLYEKHGFATVGEFTDSRGKWMVMTAQLS